MYRIMIGLIGVLVVSTVALGADLFNSNGFEDYELGALAGQADWGGLATGGATAPTVVTSPDPVIGQKAVALRVGDVQGDSSTMGHAISLNSVANQVVTVSFDIYRPQPAQDKLAQNLWWWWFDVGEPTYGLQWDIGGTLPHGWSTGAGSASTVYDQYANVTMVWDMPQGKAYSWYNGVLVDDGIAISGITSLSGWTIQLAHDAADGSGDSVAYIDNFVISAVPEPASLAMLAIVTLLLRRRR